MSLTTYPIIQSALTKSEEITCRSPNPTITLCRDMLLQDQVITSQENTSSHTKVHQGASKTLSSYFSNIKKQIQNKVLSNQEQTIKNITKIFILQTEKDDDALIKIIVTCINLICRIIHNKKSVHNDCIKHLVNPKFIGGFLRLDVKKILQQNRNIESSICYLLQLCHENKIFNQSRAKGLIPLYKKFVLEFLGQISDSPKVVYNVMRILEYLEISGFIHSQDYSKYSVLQNLRQKILVCKGDDKTVYDLGYKLMLKAGGYDSAYMLFNELNSVCKKESRSSFFRSLVNSWVHIQERQFDKLVGQQLFQGCTHLQNSFFQLLQRYVRGVGALSFVYILQSNFLQLLSCQWRQVVIDEIGSLMGVLKIVLKRSKQFGLWETVRDKIEMLIPILRVEEAVEQDQVQISIRRMPNNN